MIIASIRQGFWESSTLLDGDKAYELREVNLNTHDRGTAKNLSDMKIEKGQNVLLLVHGYNNEPEEVRDAYRVIEDRVGALLEGQYDHVVGLTWPGGDDFWDYFSAKRRANAAAGRVRQLLLDLNKTGAVLDVMTHSMGARVLLKALKTPEESVSIRNAFLTAGAVDNESIEPGEEFHASVRHCKSVTVFHSKHDPVLQTGYVVSEWDLALGYTGPEDPGIVQAEMNPGKGDVPGVYVVNCKNIVFRHGGYKRNEEVYSHLKKSLTGQPLEQFTTLGSNPTTWESDA